MKIELRINHYSIKLYIDGFIHVFIWRKDFVGIHSWSDGNGMYNIEFYTTTNCILSQMDTKEKWLDILKELDEKL